MRPFRAPSSATDDEAGGEADLKDPEALSGEYVVVWSEHALVGLERIEAYVAQAAPTAALRLRAALRAAGDSLAHYPERGAPIRGPYRRLLVLSPFVIRYRIEGARVVITSVRDDRRPLR